MGEQRLASGVADDASAAHEFLALYERAVGDVFSYLASRLGDRATAEDLTQEVFVAGIARAIAGETVGAGWLLAVARNKLVDHWRARAREDRKLGLVHREPGRAAGEESVVDDLGAAETALASLNPTYRAALVLRHVDDLPVADVASHLGRTIEATEQVLTRARSAFRTAYQETPT